MTFAGHSTVLLEMAGARILTDPVLRDRVLHIRRQAPPVERALTRDIDAVLLSHLHPDHLDPASLRMLGRGVSIYAPPGSSGVLRRRGFQSVTELAPGEEASVGGVQVRAVEVVHDGRRIPLGPKIKALGFELHGSASVFFAGDTAPFDTDEVARIDVALLPIAGWGPNLRIEHHLDPRTAAEAAASLGARTVVPIHWGTLLRMGLKRRSDELLTGPMQEFSRQMAEHAPGVELRVLRPGESMPLA